MSGSTTRRGVLAGAVAIAGLTALPRFLNPSSIRHLVVDERLAHSAAFASGFGGSRIHRVSALDDLCNRWYTKLRKHVQADAGHLAGLTTWLDYVVMRSCAAEIGYGRTFYLATTLDHPQSWAQAMGRALASGDFSATAAATGPGPVRMVTWVFAPRSV